MALTLACSACDAFGGSDGDSDKAAPGTDSGTGTGTGTDSGTGTGTGTGTGSGPNDATASGMFVRGKAAVDLLLTAERSITVPARFVQPGDSVWVMLAIQGDTFVVATPSAPFQAKTGPTWIQQGGKCPNGNFAYTVFTRVATADEPTDYTFTIEKPAQMSALALAVAGVDVVRPVDDEASESFLRRVQGDAGGDTYLSPSLRTTTSGAFLLYLLGDNSGGTWQDPLPPTLRVATTGVLAAFARSAPVPGNVEPAAFGIRTCGYSSAFGKVVALRPKG